MSENISIKSRKQIIIHPFLFATFPILSIFANNINSVSFDEIIIPLLSAIFITFLIWIALGRVLKNKIKSGFITSLGLILFFFYGHIYIFFNNLQYNNDLSHLFILVPSLILVGIGSYFFIRTKKSLNNLTKIVNVIAVSLVVISFIGIGEYFIVEKSYEFSEISSEEIFIPSAGTEDLPDVYFIILDGYPGFESIKYFLNYEDSEFVDFLTNKGFYVSEESYSNYRRTSFSITSTLNMMYLNYLAEGKEIDSKDQKELGKLSKNNLVFQKFKSQGYFIATIENGWKLTKNMKLADVRLCTSDNNVTSEFNIILFHTTILNPIYVEIFSGENRDIILCGFSELIKSSELNESPKFVFAHLMMPHRPYIFDENCGPVIPKSLSLNPDVSQSSPEFLLGQIKCTSKKVKEVVEKLTDSNNPPVIIIQSDHGMRKIKFKGDDEKWFQYFNNFNAYYFPEKGRNLEFETTTQVNSFRIFFNLYFNDTYELLEDKMYFNDRDKPYEFIDVTEFLIKN